MGFYIDKNCKPHKIEVTSFATLRGCLYFMSTLNRVESTSSGWASEEFKEVYLGDQILTSRLIKLADRFSALPESPINQACLN